VETRPTTVTAGAVVHPVILADPETLHMAEGVPRFGEDGATFGALVPVTVAVKVIEEPTLGVELLTARVTV
jgi:hypothetical protein